MLKRLVRSLEEWLVFGTRRLLGFTKTCDWCGAAWNERCERGCIGLFTK